MRVGDRGSDAKREANTIRAALAGHPPSELLLRFDGSLVTHEKPIFRGSELDRFVSFSMAKCHIDERKDAMEKELGVSAKLCFLSARRDAHLAVPRAGRRGAHRFSDEIGGGDFYDGNRLRFGAKEREIFELTNDARCGVGGVLESFLRFGILFAELERK